MLKSIGENIKILENKLIAMRRDLHEIPETGDRLPQTRKYVCNVLDEIGITYKLNECDDGLVAEIKGRGDGKTIAFRADMDGLNIIENTGLPYKSKTEGKMHGCGHDLLMFHLDFSVLKKQCFHTLFQS